MSRNTNKECSIILSFRNLRNYIVAGLTTLTVTACHNSPKTGEAVAKTAQIVAKSVKTAGDDTLAVMGKDAKTFVFSKDSKLPPLTQILEGDTLKFYTKSDSIDFNKKWKLADDIAFAEWEKVNGASWKEWDRIDKESFAECSKVDKERLKALRKADEAGNSAAKSEILKKAEELKLAILKKEKTQKSALYTKKVAEKSTIFKKEDAAKKTLYNQYCESVRPAKY